MASGSSGLPLQLNTWEDHALDVCSLISFAAEPMQTKPTINPLCNQYQFPAQPAAPVESENTTASSWIRLQDPVIYPGIYSSSGVDVMGILVRIRHLHPP